MTAPADRQTVLIVEDDADTREALLMAVDLAGFQALAAVNGRDALDRLQSGVRPSLILLDMMMPVMDGLEFLTQRRRLPDVAAIPVVVLTAYDRMTHDSRAQGLLAKPVSLENLFAVLTRFCGPTAVSAPGQRS